MCPLNDSEVRCFLDSWFSDTSVAEQLERSINSHENLCELKRLPLFLSLLAELWSHKTSLPISIYQLYEEATDLLLGDWDHQRAVFRQNIYEKPLKRLFLTKWAAACLSRQTLSLSVPAFMKSFSRLATPWSIETTDTYHILTELEQASGLLHHISRGDQWTFSHRSLMDFFAARMLVVAEQHEIEKELRSCKDIKNWIPSLALAISALQQSSEANKLTSIVSQLFSPMAQREIKLLAQKNGNLFSSQSKPTHS
jgi:predicted NACHT family NTPase